MLKSFFIKMIRAIFSCKVNVLHVIIALTTNGAILLLHSFIVVFAVAFMDCQHIYGAVSH